MAKILYPESEPLLIISINTLKINLLNSSLMKIKKQGAYFSYKYQKFYYTETGWGSTRWGRAFRKLHKKFISDRFSPVAGNNMARLLSESVY